MASNSSKDDTRDSCLSPDATVSFGTFGVEVVDMAVNEQ